MERLLPARVSRNNCDVQSAKVFYLVLIQSKRRRISLLLWQTHHTIESKVSRSMSGPYLSPKSCCRMNAGPEGHQGYAKQMDLLRELDSDFATTGFPKMCVGESGFLDVGPVSLSFASPA